MAELDKAGATLVMVSHDLRLAAHFDEVLRLDSIASMPAHA